MSSVTADSVDSFSKVNRQERGVFEGSDELSDNCFSDNDIEWNSEEDVVISCGENDNLWEEFQQSTFWSPLCSIKQCYTSTSCDNVEDEVPLVKLYLLHIYDFFLHNNNNILIVSLFSHERFMRHETSQLRFRGARNS